MSQRRWFGRAVAALRDARALRRNRVIGACAVLLVLQALLLAGIVMWERGDFGPSRSPFVSDFLSFYAAGRLALQGMPELAYDENAHWFAEQALGAADLPYNYFFYPPPFLLLCAALAVLPYWAALIAFEASTLAAYVLVACRIAAIGGWAWCVPALAFPSVFWGPGLGQNAFLSAALFGASTLLIDTRPLRSGLLFGLLCYKPQFSVLIPAAYVAGGHWRALFASCAMAVAVVGGTAWLFGLETWLRYIDALAGAGHVYGSGTILFAGFVTPFGAARLVGASVETAMSVQVLSSVLAVAIVAWIWHAKVRLPVRAAALISGTLISVPVVLLYDLTLIGICIAWFVRAGMETGFLPWEKLLLALLYVLTFVMLPVGWTFHVPLGVLVPSIMLGLCLRRALAIEA